EARHVDPVFVDCELGDQLIQEHVHESNIVNILFADCAASRAIIPKQRICLPVGWLGRDWRNTLGKHGQESSLVRELRPAGLEHRPSGRSPRTMKHDYDGKRLVTIVVRRNMNDVTTFQVADFNAEGAIRQFTALDLRAHTASKSAESQPSSG